MKIAHVMAGPLQTGAGLGALALARGLRAQGVRSDFVGRVTPLPDAEFPCHPPPLIERLAVGVRLRLEERLRVRRFGVPEVMFLPVSAGLAPHKHPVVRAADVVVVQWSHAATLGRGFWRWLERDGARVVFMLRDMWLFTGGCHFSGDCLGYRQGCPSCPVLGGVPQRVTADEVALKRRALFGAGAVVAISEGIARAARSSTVLRDRPVQVIPNAIDTAAFGRLDKAQARALLGLPQDRPVVAFGALNLSEPRKGAQVLQRIVAAMGEGAGVHWATFGSNPFPMPPGTTAFGRVDDRARLNAIYAAADVFLMPSLQESFGKVTAEALASGTPVIAFRDTPAEEILTDASGWLVPHGDAAAMQRALQAALALPRPALAAMGLAGHGDIRARFAPEVVAARHVALYRSVIASAAGRA